MLLVLVMGAFLVSPGVAYADHDTLPQTDLNYAGNWIVIIVVSIFEIGFAAAMLWAVRDGQFHDIEGIKYRMLRVDDEAFHGWVPYE